MIDQNKVKNVILDLGGVLIDIDERATYTGLQRIFKPEVFETIDWDGLPEAVIAMETGKWSKSYFKNTMLDACKPGVSPSQMVDAWCAMLNEFKTSRVTMVKQLGEKYNLYLFSNTNVYHVHFFETEFRFRYHTELASLFKKVYYSNEIGLRKPNTDAFEYILKDAGLKAEETVMVDDRQENCVGANATGMQAIKVPVDSGLEAVIDQLL